MNRAIITIVFFVFFAAASVEARAPFRIYNDARVSHVSVPQASSVSHVSYPMTGLQAPTSQRDVIRSMHILDRPSRVGHFYGNTVRRVYHYGQVLPRLRRR